MGLIPGRQTSLRGLFGVMFAASFLFAGLRWLGVPPVSAAIVGLLVAVSCLAAWAFVLVASEAERDDFRPPTDGD